MILKYTNTIILSLCHITIHYASLQFNLSRYLIEMYTKWVQICLRHFFRRHAFKDLKFKAGRHFGAMLHHS